jgi:glycosyltransferase involved in cell wall biosynthesis
MASLNPSRADASAMIAQRGARMPQPLQLMHVFPTFAVGGAQMRFATLANALGPGLKHVVVSLDGIGGAESLVRPGVSVRLWRTKARKGRGLSLGNLRAFRRALREEWPDLLLTYNWGAIEWALADRLRPICPHVHVVDGFGPEEAVKQLPRRVWLRRLALSGRTTVVVPSQALRRLVIETWKLDPSKVRHVPNGVDAAALARDAREPFGVRREADEVLLGTVGGLRPEKNLGRLLRITAMLPNSLPWRLVIAGDGQERASLEAQAHALGLSDRVAFTGFVDRPGSLLGELDVYVLTSDTEQMPISVLEAMVVGLPVLATDVGDLRIMLPAASRSTCLFARDQESAFAERLAALLAAPDERRRLGALNRAHATEFSLAAMVASYDRLFREVAGQAERAGAG